MKKKIIFTIVLFLIIKFKVSALTYGGCSYSEISRLKSLVSNVNISYDYHIDDNYNFARFDVTLNNITEGMYFVDSFDNKVYYYSDSQNGEITIKNYSHGAGKFNFYSALSECYGTKLGSKYYKFPSYNVYYKDPLCEGLSDFSLCQKWAKVEYSRDKFEELVYEYKNNSLTDEPIDNKIIYKSNFFNKIINFYVNYYYYFFIFVIVICSAVIFVKRKKDRFNL